MALQKNIAFFDFDGTITSKDSMLALAKYDAGKLNYYAKMLSIAPSLIAFKAGLLDAHKAKEKFLQTFFGGLSTESFASICNGFNNDVLPSIIKKDAMKAIAKHQQENTVVVVVSASAENWLKPWCTKNNLTLLGTRLLEKNGTITGKILGNNCNGKEKVSRINEIFNLTDFEKIYAYGDSSGDKEMLSIASNPHYRLFKK